MDRLRTFLETLQDSFLSGKLEAMLASFSLPTVIYSVVGVTVLRDKVDFLHTAQKYHAALIAKAVVASSVEIIERDHASKNRSRVTVRIVDMDSRGNKVTTSLIRYFLVHTKNSYRIEMMEYLEAPLSSNEIERIIH